MNLYWGDIHNHCGITYGFGSLENALDAAREQLDFCEVTGHAMWPDMPERTKEVEFLVDFHTKGFNKLKMNWENVRSTIEKANKPGEFVTFQGYEMHSSKYGDHHIVSPSGDLKLLEADSPAELIKKLAPAKCIAIPHHVAYTPGYRGINWDEFSNVISPVVEVYSKHGCGMSDGSMYQYLHTMGPRDSRNTVYTGIRKGKRFGFVGSTDHHAGYPGSYGDGRLAVLAKEKTRESIWEAILSRRTYAITGDKIKCNFTLNGALFGSEVNASASRNIVLDVTACDYIDKMVIYKNLKPWKVINGEMLPATKNTSGTYKVRVEMGWGNSVTGYSWNGCASIKDGLLESVEPCFRGRSVLAPSPEMKENPEINALGNKITSKTDTSVEWNCSTVKNPTTMHSQTDSLILEIKGDENTLINLNCNGKNLSATIGELMKGSISFHVKPYSSEAVLVHRAVPASAHQFHGEWKDDSREQECDVYHVEIRQVNGQFAWISPIFALA